MGRFINADGIVGFVGVELSHNIYTYTGNNPVMNVDPSGYACELASPDSYGFAGGPCGGGLGLGFYTQSGVPAPGMSKPAAQQMKSQAIDEMKYVAKSLEKVATNTYDKVENWVVRAVEDAGNWSKQAGNDTKDWINNDFLPWVNNDDPNRFDYENIIFDTIGTFAAVFATGTAAVGVTYVIPGVNTITFTSVFILSASAAVGVFGYGLWRELNEKYE